MIFSEVGFRPLYHRFTAFELNEKLRGSLDHLPGIEAADSVLCYGYYDEQRGITLEVIAAGSREGDAFRFEDANEEVSGKIRIETVEDVPFECIDDSEGNLYERYSSKLDGLVDNYEPQGDVRTTREMTFLDECRDKVFIDDVLVYLTRDGFDPEGCWTRIIGLGDHFFVGTLLNEPDQPFGWHMGEKISFFLNKTEDGHTVCISDMNPSRKLKRSDLKDGTMLRDAIITFNNDRTQANFIEVLELLGDSYVWIPCNAVISDDDEEMLLKMVEAADDPEDLVGEEFRMNNEVRLVPDILQNGDDLFFPVFSGTEEMGEYGEHFSKMEKPFLDAVRMAQSHEEDLAGIVVNAFSYSFVLDRELFDMVLNFKSRIVEDEEEPEG